MLRRSTPCMRLGEIMRISSALKLIGELQYKPGWKFTAEDHSNRFEGSITLRIDYPARNSNRDQAEAGYPEEITTYASFPMIVADCEDDELYFRILQLIGEIEMHEAREFLRIAPTMWAPFHPHKVDGMKRWAARTGGNLEADLQFGIA